MFKHSHPYQPFIKNDTKKLIVGTLPPPRFSTGNLLQKDVDFCYGSYYNSLWLFIDKIHNLNLRYDNSQEAITQRQDFLIEHKIGVCDIVSSCEREKINASDLGMTNIKLRDLVGYLKQYPSIETILFTGGNSKNGPEYFFRKHLKNYNLKLNLISKETPKIHSFVIPSAARESVEKENTSRCHSEQSEEFNNNNNNNNNDEISRVALNDKRTIKTVSLTSSSGAANISIGSNSLYKQLKASNPKFTTFDFRVLQYREFL